MIGGFSRLLSIQQACGGARLQGLSSVRFTVDEERTGISFRLCSSTVDSTLDELGQFPRTVTW